jgi:WD40 repeat protein/tRNA A-37 threonylcarbamoyl transferase component Bud32
MPEPPLERLEALFHEAADLEPEQQSAFLDACCAGDPELRTAVEDLLRQDAGARRTESFLTSPLARPDASTVPSVPPSPGAPPSAPAIPGYEVLGELGRGGMGVVYKARQAVPDRVVALKMLLTDTPVRGERLVRFRTEMEALARLRHPNVVQIFEVGEAERRPYFTMEYVPGPNLAQRLAAGPLPPQPAAQLLELLARAVEAVHRCRVLHRDLKPANILLSTESKVLSTECGPTMGLPSLSTQYSVLSTDLPKISDFGLAKLVKDAADGAPKLTRTGQAMGTPCYMAPEQARGETQAIGPAADVYGLGAILYEALTGRPPFEGATAAETIHLVLTEEPVSPAVFQPKLPRDLVTICLKCLEKDPAKRYAAAGDLAEDLKRFQDGEPIRARPVSRAERVVRWCRRRPLVAALLGLSAALIVALLISALSAISNLRRALEAEKELSEAERRQLVQLNVVIGMHDAEAGDAFTALLRFTEALRLDEHQDGEWKQRVRIATTLRQCPDLVGLLVLGGPVLAERPSPRGGWFVVAAEKVGVRVWDVKAGRPAGSPVDPGAGVLRAALGPDGRLLAIAGADDTVRVWEVATGTASTPRLPGGGPIRRLAFHPAGRILLALRADGRVRRWDLASKEERPVQELPDGAPANAAISDDGRWVFTQGVTHTGRVWDAGTGKPVGGPWPLPDAVTRAAFGPDGHRVALVAGNVLRIREVATGEVAGGLLRYPQEVTRLEFSPDGHRLVTVCSENTVWLWPTARGAVPVATVRHQSTVTQARFSPDGRLLVTGGDDNYARVWDSATGEPVTPLLKHNGRIVRAAFSADGKEVVTAARDGVVRWWRLRPAPGVITGGSTEREPAAPQDVRSPDGRRVLRWEGSVAQVTDGVTGASVGWPLRHGSTVAHGAFSPDGRRVVTAGDDNVACVWDAETGTRLLAPLPHQGIVNYAAFSPDGKTLITASADRTARVWDAATGEPLTPPLPHPDDVVRAQISPDGRQATTVDADGLRRTWDLSPADAPLSDLRALAQTLAGSSIDGHNRLAPLAGEELKLPLGH